MALEKKLFVIRHGETDYNKNGKVQGRGVDASLNETGLKQSRAFYNAFREEDFSILFTSSLKRSSETVKPFIEDGIEHIIRPELDEIDWGIHEGILSSEHSKSQYHELVREWRSGNVHARIEGGESPIEVQQRQKVFLNDLMQREERTNLLCMHGRAIRILMCTLTGTDLAKMDDFPHQNLGLYEVDFNGRYWEIVRYNDSSHLNG